MRGYKRTLILRIITMTSKVLIYIFYSDLVWWMQLIKVHVVCEGNFNLKFVLIEFIVPNLSQIFVLFTRNL